MRTLRVLAVAATAMMLTAAVPAAADSWRHGDHGRHFKQDHGNGHWRHRDRARVFYGGSGYVYYPPPQVYYAPPPPPVYYAPPPPPVYYAPPPVYYAPAPSISFGVTLPFN